MTPEDLKAAYALLSQRNDLKNAAKTLLESEEVNLTDDDEFVFLTLRGEVKHIVYNTLITTITELDAKLTNQYNIEMRYGI